MDDSLQLPRATLDKLIKEYLPSDIGCVKETRQVLMNCCIEFIHLITSEANETCEKFGKKTINGEHIISALEALGFEEFVSPVKAAFEDFKTQSKKYTLKKPKSEKPEETLLLEQQKLFEQSKAKLDHAFSPKEENEIEEEIIDVMDESDE
eukprot:NODE_185_length_13590_cov_0.472908.p11 type:complete len:151 gc:universal NODE_185_length_13590_cov_0.472908:5828-5376(-)